jgi:hypothetical protein
MKPMRMAMLAILVCGCSTVGEYYHERAWNTSRLPAGTIDVEASEVLVTSAEPIIVASGEGLRHELADVVQSALHTGDEPARFRVRANLHRQRGWMLFFPCLIFLADFGCPIGQEVAEVEIDLESGGRRWSARAEEAVWQGYYYNADGIRAALARATGGALQKMSEGAR